MGLRCFQQALLDRRSGRPKCWRIWRLAGQPNPFDKAFGGIHDDIDDGVFGKLRSF